MVEARRRNKSDCGALGQSERYSKDITLEDGEAADVSQPACGASGEFRVPFVFYTNGRPYLKLIETESGISFRDARKPTNLARGLIDAADSRRPARPARHRHRRGRCGLKAQPIQFSFPVRPY